MAFALQHKRCIESHEKDFTGEVFARRYFTREGGVRPVPKRRAKWPGKHQELSKCRSAWKSTCMRAPPAN